MRSSYADTSWVDTVDRWESDRAPGLPLLGFLFSTLISVGLWVVISWTIFRLFA